jgi:hypothetical protein
VIKLFLQREARVAVLHPYGTSLFEKTPFTPYVMLALSDFPAD